MCVKQTFKNRTYQRTANDEDAERKKQRNSSNLACYGAESNVLMKGALTFSCLWGHSHSPLCSPVGWPGTAGTCCHPQSASEYMISLSHFPHPASQATWKGLWEPPQTAWDGQTLNSQTNLYLNWGVTGKATMEHIKFCVHREHMFAFVQACLCVLVHISLVEMSCFGLPCWESDGIAWEQIISHVRYKWQTGFSSTNRSFVPHWLNRNSRRTVGQLSWGLQTTSECTLNVIFAK